jgi:hypothetical protein
MLLRPFTIDAYGQFGPLTYLTLHGTTFPHKTKKPDKRTTIGLGHAPAKHALEQNYHKEAPTGLFPLADKQWKQNLDDQHKHHTTHWFTNTYHARLPSQWGKQVISYNVTKALATYYHKAAKAIRKAAIDAEPGTRPANIPGTHANTNMTPRTHYNLPGRPVAITPGD